ncbi:MAG: DnaA regulatory inactivator Hda [Halioglobus sp.]|jgi:DnaA family protein
MTPVPVPEAQLALEVRLRDEATFDNFLAGPATRPLVDALQRQLEEPGEAIIFIYGPGGSGKSHLLQAACHRGESRALYLPLAELRSCPADEVLQGVESRDLVCLDDVQRVVGDESWEEALFHLCNRARQRGCRLLVAGDAAPRALALELEDLRSRLGWGIVYQLTRPGDEEKAAILQFRAARRGLALPGEVAVFIVSRAPRALEQLLELLERLDRASLARQRALSIPFVKQTLGW